MDTDHKVIVEGEVGSGEWIAICLWCCLSAKGKTAERAVTQIKIDHGPSQKLMVFIRKPEAA